MSAYELPEGWIHTKLGKVVDYGKATKCNLEDLQPDTWVLELEDIEKGTSKLIQRIEASNRPFKSTKNVFKTGDVLYGKLRPYLNKVLVAETSGVCTTEIIPIDAEPYVNNRYLFHWLRGAEFLTYVDNVSYGVNMPRLGTKEGVEAPLVLAPYAEQQVIADKLDIFLAQVESIKTRLERIPEILKQFRQSVLAAAVSGKLTEEWNVQACLLSDVAEFQNGYAFKSEWFSNAGSYQVIKLGNIRDGRLFVENAPAYVDGKIGQEFERFKPSVGDTLISMTGTRFKQDYGFGCLVETNQDILINQRVGRLIPLREKIIPEFLNLFIRSELFRRQFFQGETGGVNQGNVGSKHIISLSIDVPRIEIQIEVVNKVVKALNAVTAIEEQVQSALDRVNNLTQSILAKAFCGELTAEWREANPDLISGENSAEALLERIKAERSAKPVTKRSRGKA